MPRLTWRFIGCAAAQGLRAFEHVTDDGVRLAIPLHRASARAAKARLAGGARRALFPGTPFGAMEALVVERGARVSYVLGGDVAALRRVLIVEAASPTRAAEALAELGLERILDAPSPAACLAHARALELTRRAPREGGRLWLDAEEWPPPADAIDAAAVRASVELGPVRVEPDEVLGLAALGAPIAAEWPLIKSIPTVDGVVAAMTEGLLARRWRLVCGDGLDDGESPEDDLRGGGARFTFARVLLEEHALEREYRLRLRASCLHRLDRFTLARDRFGSDAALAEAISDTDLDRRARDGLLRADHELVFLDALTPSGVERVECRDHAARDALLARLPALSEIATIP